MNEAISVRSICAWYLILYFTVKHFPRVFAQSVFLAVFLTNLC
jgi:hypothetical protein